jgi:probable F420-dependent oxidoreductase
MKIGFAIPVMGSWATPANQARIARRAEELGYHSVWTLQRLLNPADQADETYGRPVDPLLSLAYVAGQTERIRLGVAVVNMPFFSPALLAKQLTTLDILSGGRLDAGLGLGWMPQEFAASGVPVERRGARAEEFLSVLQALWTQEITEFSGSFYQVPPVRMDPKPVQVPHPPVLLGGAAGPSLRRAGRRADGWVSASRADLAHIGEPIEVVKDAARQEGRDPDALRFVCRGVTRPGKAGQPDRRPLSGSYEEIRGDLDGLAAQGVTEVFFDLNFGLRTGAATADASEIMDRAGEALEALAP